jgi:hypothetical protein
MKIRKHICLDPDMHEAVEKWAAEGFRSYSAQYTMLIQQELTRRQRASALDRHQASDNGKEARAE